MEKLLQNIFRLLANTWGLCFALSCHNGNEPMNKGAVGQLNLKRGDIISCGTGDKDFGQLDFEISCDKQYQSRFNLGIELLHSFEYDEAEKAFAKIIDQDSSCAMAYWGVAMCNFHALWTAPTNDELVKGTKALRLAQSVQGKSKKEKDYIDALAAFYDGWENIDHTIRCRRYEKAMEKLWIRYPADKEAAVFYALALDASADPNDKTFTNQLKAAKILRALYPGQPNHPGIIHYIIHTYDYPQLADSALEAARRYAKVAPSSAHALHMPSHIFTRLGLWDESINSNLASVASAKCYAEQAHINGHWDEELHGMDYLVYAYLQKGDNKAANEQLQYLRSITNVFPVNFKVAYAFAAIPSRYYLENKNWRGAATLPLSPASFDWKSFPWQEAIIHFSRLLGAVHLNQAPFAAQELAKLKELRDKLGQQKDAYKSKQVSVQIQTCEAWIRFAWGDRKEALANMKIAAEMEDSTQKHPVTPGEVLPARELLADMLLEMQQYQAALQAYEMVLQKSPNRFNSLCGAGKAAESLGDHEKASYFYQQLQAITNGANCDRAELDLAKSYR